MSNVHIFVEGVADQKFIQDLIHEWYGQKLPLGALNKPGRIMALGGKNAFDSPQTAAILTPMFAQINARGEIAIVIADADTFNENNRIFSGHSQTYNFSYFLLPNNTDDGDLETLLQELIQPDNRIIFDCWQNYEDCLSGRDTPNTVSGRFTLPARKTKIYAYLEALLGESNTEKEKIKEKERDYRNKTHWSLNPDHPYLSGLKTFLDPFFTSTTGSAV